MLSMILVTVMKSQVPEEEREKRLNWVLYDFSVNRIVVVQNLIKRGQQWTVNRYESDPVPERDHILRLPYDGNGSFERLKTDKKSKMLEKVYYAAMYELTTRLSLEL